MCSGVSEGPFTCVLPIFKLRMTIFFCFGLGRLQKTRILLLDFLNILQNKTPYFVYILLHNSGYFVDKAKKKVKSDFCKRFNPIKFLFPIYRVHMTSTKFFDVT